MATWKVYKCKDCGYNIATEPQGHYVLMSGEYYNFRCAKCKEIVSINIKDSDFMPTCPECGAANKYLYAWSAKNGKCPKCGGEMKASRGGVVINAD